MICDKETVDRIACDRGLRGAGSHALAGKMLWLGGSFAWLRNAMIDENKMEYSSTVAGCSLRMMICKAVRLDLRAFAVLVQGRHDPWIGKGVEGLSFSIVVLTCQFSG